MKKKILIIGYGSIGKKHASIINKYYKEFKLYILSSRTIKKYENIISLKNIKTINPDFIIIASETYKHHEQLLFIEKNFKNKKTKFCIGRIFSFTDKNQKKPFVIPSLVEKIKKSSDTKIIINNIDHYRDFLPTKDIALAIKVLFNKNCSGIYNIGSGKKINLKNIALMIAKKNKKKIYFKKDRKTTYLISNINKIKTLGWKPRKFKKNINYFY